MLLTGDITRNKHLALKGAKDIDIIYTQEYETYVKNIFGLKKPIDCEAGNGTKTFDKKDRTYYLHNATFNEGLNNLLVQTFAKNNVVREIPRIYEYAILKAKLMYNYLDEDKRHHDAIYASIIYEDVISKLDANHRAKVMSMSEQLDGWARRLPYIEEEAHVPDDFDIYSAADLANLVTISKESLYMRMEYSSGYAQQIWHRFTDEERMRCILEHIQITGLNEVVVPYWHFERQIYEERDNDLFKSVVMRICSSYPFTWYIDFIIQNYGELYERYSSNYINIFRNAVKFGDIEPISK